MEEFTGRHFTISFSDYLCIGSGIQLSCRMDSCLSKISEIPRGVPGIGANVFKSDAILKVASCKRDRNPLKSDDILRGTPCKTEANPLKSDELVMITPCRIHTSPLRKYAPLYKT